MLPTLGNITEREIFFYKDLNFVKDSLTLAKDLVIFK